MAAPHGSSSGSIPPPGTIHWSGFRLLLTNSTCRNQRRTDSVSENCGINGQNISAFKASSLLSFHHKCFTVNTFPLPCVPLSHFCIRKAERFTIAFMNGSGYSTGLLWFIGGLSQILHQNTPISVCNHLLGLNVMLFWCKFLDLVAHKPTVFVLVFVIL